MPKPKGSPMEKMSIDELTILMSEEIIKKNMKLVEGIDYLIKDDYENYNKNLKYIIETQTEVQIKRVFERKIFKTKKSSFSKADRLKTFSRINDMKEIVEYIANKLLLYRVNLPDKDFKENIASINSALRNISAKILDAVKLIGTNLEEAHKIAEEIKEERYIMRNEEFQLLDKLWNYEVDYIGRTWYYLKELIEGIMMLGDHIKKFAENIQLQTTKYVIFK